MELKLLKEGEVGYGLLVEKDSGYISPQITENKKIIKEMNEVGTSYGPIQMVAVLQKCGVQNRNGRIYPEKILRDEVDKHQEVIKNGRAISELNHPDSSIIDLERTSHKLDETWWDGNTLMGKLTLITSPAYENTGITTTPGDLAANLLRHGVQLGISSRGVGSLESVGGQNMVQSDFELICFDLVSSPSTPGAYLFNQVEEAKPYVESVNPKPIMESTIDTTIKNFLKD
jgi:hypothetical protein|tara:strand:- start:386 stop:1075 length:690 start_codon:yes stop_codon:yes gene_type:complete